MRGAAFTIRLGALAVARLPTRVRLLRSEFRVVSPARHCSREQCLRCSKFVEGLAEPLISSSFWAKVHRGSVRGIVVCPPPQGFPSRSRLTEVQKLSIVWLGLARAQVACVCGVVCVWCELCVSSDTTAVLCKTRNSQKKKKKRSDLIVV